MTDTTWTLRLNNMLESVTELEEKLGEKKYLLLLFVAPLLKDAFSLLLRPLYITSVFHRCVALAVCYLTWTLAKDFLYNCKIFFVLAFIGFSSSSLIQKFFSTYGLTRGVEQGGLVLLYTVVFAQADFRGLFEPLKDFESLKDLGLQLWQEPRQQLAKLAIFSILFMLIAPLGSYAYRWILKGFVEDDEIFVNRGLDELFELQAQLRARAAECKERRKEDAKASEATSETELENPPAAAATGPELENPPASAATAKTAPELEKAAATDKTAPELEKPLVAATAPAKNVKKPTAYTESPPVTEIC